MGKKNGYIPALSFSWLTPIYDPVLKWGMQEERFKRALIRQAQLQPGMRVLDVGCGTATLTVMLKLAHPQAEVVGLDGDPQVLAIGREKAAQAGAALTLDHGLASNLPYPDGAFDRVVSSLVTHHLVSEDKQRAMREAWRVLRPGGELHIVDYGKPHGAYARLASLLIRRLEQAGDNIQGRLPEYMRAAGFAQVTETGHFTTLLGGLSLYQAQKYGNS